MEKKIRMADIAEQLGVSIVSVSKALSGKEGVSEETRTAILTLAKEMGYTPLRSRESPKAPVKSGNIGILKSSCFLYSGNNFYSSLYDCLVMYCSDQGFSSMLELVTPEAEKNCRMPTIVQEKKVDGLIFLGEISRQYLRTVIRCGLPYVLLDFYDEDLDADSVTSDNISGGYRLTNHLLQTGRTNIGFVGSIDATTSIMDRFLGYSKALLRAGIPIRKDWIIRDRDGRTDLHSPVLPENMPQAFVCSCDETALTMVELLKSSGYRVPEEVAVAGYDDSHFSRFCSPQLTTYQVNVQGMGRMAVTQIIRRIKKKHTTSGTIVLNGKLIKRDST